MNPKFVDQNALRTNQVVIIAFLLIGYVFDLVGIVYFTALAMLVATVFSVPAFKPIYLYIAQPLGFAKPDVRQDDPNAHRFAQFIGGLFLLAGSTFFYNNLSLPGWTLTFVVIGLASINLLTGFCVGCFFYYQLGKIGFFKTVNQ
jgi:hypothetical protein